MDFHPNMDKSIFFWTFPFFQMYLSLIDTIQMEDRTYNAPNSI